MNSKNKKLILLLLLLLSFVIGYYIGDVVSFTPEPTEKEAYELIQDIINNSNGSWQK